MLNFQKFIFFILLSLVQSHPDEIFLRIQDYQVKLPIDNDIVEGMVKNHSRIGISEKIVRQTKTDITDPLNAFFYVRDGLYQEQTIKNVLKEGSATLKQLRSLEKIVPLKEDDLTSAAKQIFNLQLTYNLSSTYFTDGLEGPTYCARPLKIFSIFQIALIACELKRYYHCIDWMENVDSKKKIDWDPRVLREKQLEAIGLALLLQGNLKRAWLVSRELSRLNPKKEGARKNVVQLKKFLKGRELEDLEYIPPLNNRLTGDSPLNRVCRNYNTIPFYQNSTAICYYQRRSYISHFKVQMIYLDPLIRVYHDVLGDAAATKLRTLSKGNLKRGLVFNSNTGVVSATPTRTSLTADLRNITDIELERIDRMVEEMTGLDPKAGEALKVNNYGIGGLYKPHYDHILNATAAPPATGRRIATALFYLNTPHKGGATVFTKLNIHVAPAKGSAIFWYNLHEDGSGDDRTQHAGCAVLSGEKWIANKWIFERGQEFRRRCTIRK
ncbi:unnamed protein product [Bursaphelenchus xylophilus]|uniref:procollagen-proline 4-dioxygenase n=1 Tax=Bursaphelenchus xylophilus TaxID=6326 RepID=A0A1I7S4X5_BURXY|nr:unnamed protein product [Bursaphelenchus xylophilus]CAG9117473.1 unnamed protein product [Bursaphelenchus xylophilus]